MDLVCLNRTFIDFQLCRIQYVCEGNVISSWIWNFVCSKSRYGGRNLTKKSAKMGWKWHVWETEIRSTIGLIFSDVTGCTQRARGRVYCIVVYCFPIQLIALKILISRKMEENTLELSFEVDVSEGDEEKDRNYSLDSDNDDGDLGDFDPEAGDQDAAVGGVPVQPAAYLHEPAGSARDCWMMIKVYNQEEITFPSQTYRIRHNWKSMSVRFKKEAYSVNKWVLARRFCGRTFCWFQLYIVVKSLKLQPPAASPTA